jgi:hypothetical protein
MDSDLDKAIKGNDLGIPRGIKGITTYQGPNTVGPIPVELMAEPAANPFRPCLDDVLNRLPSADQHLVRQHISILSGERFPKSSGILAERLDRMVGKIKHRQELEPEGDNKKELLELFAIFATHYIHYI